MARSTVAPGLFKFRQRGLLCGGENLIESGLRGSFNRNQLSGQPADGRGSRGNIRTVVGDDCGLEGLVCGFHLIVQRGRGCGGGGEDRRGLLLLGRGQS